MELMKKVVVLVAMVLVWASQAQAVKGPANVANTIHNLSTFNVTSAYRTDSTEVCVFCHTPHGGRLSTPTWGSPLWNRDDADPTLIPLEGWTYYNSATVTDDTKAIVNATGVSGETMMCLSCHDGSIAANQVHNPPNGLTGPMAPQPTNVITSDDVEIRGFIPGNYARIGGTRVPGFPGQMTQEVGELQDDHPVSFSYADVLANNPSEPLQTVAYATARGVRFFGGAQARVECSSCHDPHVDYIANASYDPFLITSNGGSYLCLSCHNK